MPEEGKQSFLVEALHHPLQTAVLFLIALVGITLLLLIVALGLPHLFTGEITFVGTTPTIRIQMRGVTGAYILHVPAAQLNIPTGIFLEPDRSYMIRATGAVSTLKAPLPTTSNRLSPPKNGGGDLNQWKDPDGEYLYHYKDPKPETNCIAKLSDQLRLDTGANYGELLALIVKAGESPDYETYRNKNHKSNFVVIRIGKGRTIAYDKKAGLFNIKDTEGRPIKEESASYLGGSSGYLYFQVNDTVITDKSQFELGECKNATKNEIKWRQYFKQVFVDMMIGVGGRKEMAPGVWYLDNDGSFTVSVVVD